VLRVIFVGLTLTGIGAAGADEGSGASAGAPGNSSEQVWPAVSGFRLDALEINVYGLSYHPDRETVHRLHLDNQVNPGLGLHYSLADDARGTTFAEVGAYQDSGKNLASFAGVGYQFKLGERWKIGAALALMNSETYNNGVGFVGMIPLVTCDLGRIKLNAVYFPRFGNYNKVEAFGFYLGIPFAPPAR
jgi:hypothetical protein